MAKKIDGYIKLNIPAGSANPSPPVGPALGQRGVNIIGIIVIVLKVLENLIWRISKKIFAIIKPKMISIVMELNAITNVFLIAVGKTSSSNKRT